jgi:hypothetical protein
MFAEDLNKMIVKDPHFIIDMYELNKNDNISVETYLNKKYHITIYYNVSNIELLVFQEYMTLQVLYNMQAALKNLCRDLLEPIMKEDFVSITKIFNEYKTSLYKLPDLVYDEKNNKFYLYQSRNIAYSQSGLNNRDERYTKSRISFGYMNQLYGLAIEIENAIPTNIIEYEKRILFDDNKL